MLAINYKWKWCWFPLWIPPKDPFYSLKKCFSSPSLLLHIFTFIFSYLLFSLHSTSVQSFLVCTALLKRKWSFKAKVYISLLFSYSLCWILFLLYFIIIIICMDVYRKKKPLSRLFCCYKSFITDPKRCDTQNWWHDFFSLLC